METTLISTPRLRLRSATSYRACAKQVPKQTHINDGERCSSTRSIGTNNNSGSGCGGSNSASGGCFKKFNNNCPFLNKSLFSGICDKNASTSKEKGKNGECLSKKFVKQFNKFIVNSLPKNLKLSGRFTKEFLDKIKHSSNVVCMGDINKQKTSHINNNVVDCNLNKTNGKLAEENGDCVDGGALDTTLYCQSDHTVTRRTARLFREVYSVWQKRIGSLPAIPPEKVQLLFNDLQLYPSKSQVNEMLECAKECTGRPTPSYLTFGEFCVFASELKRCYDRGIPRPTQLSRLLDKESEDKQRRCRKLGNAFCKYEVFLGGSCNPTTWRSDVAIPMLKNMEITFYNPQVSQWKPELIEVEHRAKENASVVFFVLDNQTRGIVTMIEVAYLTGKRRKLILVIQSLAQQGQAICGETITDQEFNDLRIGQDVLQDLVERQGIPVFESITVALNCTAKVLRENLSVDEIGVKDTTATAAKHVSLPQQVQLENKLIKLREAFDSVDKTNSGALGLSEACLAYEKLTNRALSYEDLRNILKVHIGGNLEESTLDKINITFEQFCAIVAELQSSRTKWNLPLRPIKGEPQTLSASYRDVYLGGTVESTTWKEQIAVPALVKHGLTYFDPCEVNNGKQQSTIDSSTMDNCHVLLFVITNTARSIAAMNMAAHYIGLGCNMVLCIQTLDEDCIISNEKLTQLALRDHNRGRVYLADIAKRDGVPVFHNIHDAVECVIHKCQERLSTDIVVRTGKTAERYYKKKLHEMSRYTIGLHLATVW